MNRSFSKDSWHKVAPWYSKITNRGEGHYYHEHIVLPGVIRLLGFNSKLSTPPKLLDIACGNGVLSKHLPKNVDYLGIDIAPALIEEAKRTDRNKSHKYMIADASKPLNITEKFTHAAIILALQNIQNPKAVFENVAKLLGPNSKFVIVLNHPAFRIPRQSSWGIDESKKTQYRRIDRYMSEMEIPINMNPSDRNSAITMSYHYPISEYSKMLMESGFVIELIEEWTSDKESLGKARKMENRSRSEIPLFMAITTRKSV